MEAPMDAEAIAARFRAAGASQREVVLAEFLADDVELRHVPASEHDGVLSRAWVIAGAAAERDLLERSMRDFARTYDYAVDGDDVVELYRMRGTLQDGRVLDNLLTITYTFVDGRIAHMSVLTDPERSAPLRALFANSDLRLTPGVDA